MEAITVYKAVDGSRWDSESDALKRDDESFKTALSIGQLGERYKETDSCNYENGGGYVQHDLNTIRVCKMALIRLCRETRPHFDEWARMQESVHKVDLLKIDVGWFNRMMDDDSPMDKAWRRFYCIDAQGREWGQPYYALNPDKGEQKRLR